MTKARWFLATRMLAALVPMLATAGGWETRIYRADLPQVEADQGTFFPEAPADPTPEAIRTFLRENHRWVERRLPPGTLTPGVLCAYDPGTYTLAARVIPRSWTDGVFSGLPEPDVPKFLVHEVTVMEGTAERMREWMDGLGSIRNHRPALDQLEARIPSGEARLVSTTRIESRSGERAEVVSDGSITLQSVIGPDGMDVDTSLVLEMPGASGPVQLVTGVTGVSGESRLIGAWNPDGDPDRLRVAILIPTVATLLPAPNEDLARWIKAEGDAVAPPPPVTAELAAPTPPPDGMQVRRFRVPPSFLTVRAGGQGDPFENLGPGTPGQAPATTAHVDPFADLGSETAPWIRATAQAVLEGVGVTFPEGAYAHYDAFTSHLVVCNTKQNLDLTDAYVGCGGCCDAFTFVTATIHVVEASSVRVLSLSRRTVDQTDHTTEWKALASEPDTRILATILVPGRSGETVKFEAGRSPEGDGPSTGTTLELCPIIGPDGHTLDATVSLVLAGAKLVTAVTQHQGTTRLLGIWKPAGGAPDRHRAAFLRLDLVRED